MSADQREIKIPYALKDGEWVHISRVESGLKAGCVCPCCKKVLLAKKGIKNVHHFAHFEKVDCQQETILHFIAKNLLHRKIQQHLNSNFPFHVSWNCSFCENRHTQNILQKATKAYLEYNLGDFRPDIALLAENDMPIAAIEIVVTHKPEESAVAYYQKNKIMLIECHVFQGSDLELIQSANDLSATSVNQCTRPRCEHCENFFDEPIKMFVVSQPCKRCKQTMKICFICLKNCVFKSLNDFSEREVQIAQQYGVLLEKKFSATRNEVSLANACPHCPEWIREHYLLKFFSRSAKEEILIGYHCRHCKRDWPCRIEKIGGASQRDLPQSYSQLKFFS